jgi:HD-GYP domain-containing protein (c-di-GMP phosphodiesterase class II)
LLKKIFIDQVRAGMYIGRIEGSWLRHSMWRSSFLVSDDAGVASLRSCGAREVWIDLSRGIDVATPAEPGHPESFQASPAAAERPPCRASFADELKAAEQIRSRAVAMVTSMFQEARLGKAIDPQMCAPLITDVVDSIHRNGDALVSLSRLKLADEYTYMHSVAVCALMVALGRQLGFDKAQCHEAGLAGLMHDLGKAAVPQEVLNKPGALSDTEFDIVKRHPVLGYQMLLDASVTNSAVLAVCRSHHERMDGKGYPDRAPAAELPLVVRMGAVCDVYDAITSNRPYKAGWDPAESISRMASWKGHFDEQVLRTFIGSIGIYPTGSLVRLTSGRLAVVIGQNPARLTEPRVKVFFSANSGAQLKPAIIDLSAPDCAEKVSGREERERWQFKELDQLWLAQT